MRSTLVTRELALLFLASSLLASPAYGAEMRTLDGRYIRIITDLPPNEANEQWIAAFDAAIPKFCEFWEVPLESVDGWRATACVMSEKEPFLASGLLPGSVPDFPHGFQIGDDIWVLGQPSEYYTRHLLIHEGAHAFAFHVFGGAGPAWFMEGTAEYLATHSWDGTQIKVGVVPDSSAAFPYWGRIKMIDLRRDSLQALSLITVLRYSETAHRQVEPYAWTWAAVQLFAAYPETRKAIINAARNGRDSSPDFTRQFVADLGEQWTISQARWRVLIDELDYGYDLRRNQITSLPAAQPWNGVPLRTDVQADQGWQSAGIFVPAGTRLSLQASGRVTLAQEPEPWISEASGVTIRYHRGRPLGILLATILPNQFAPSKTILPLKSVKVAPEAVLVAEEAGWLMLKIGDSPAELADNTGNLVVQIKAER